MLRQRSKLDLTNVGMPMDNICGIISLVYRLLRSHVVADKHPYTSGPAGIVQTVTQLRRSFPTQVTSETLKKLSIAPNNEGYILNIMRFIGVLDSTNKRTADAAAVFNKHNDSDFQQGFAELVANAYHDLFDLHGDSAWVLPLDKLISYFRGTDHTSDLVGKRQASTFMTLAGISGKVESTQRLGAVKPKRNEPAKAANNGSKAKKVVQSSPITARAGVDPIEIVNSGLSPKATKVQSDGHSMALTVRVEINLPAGGDQETYDRIFKSIRANLLNGNVT